MNSGLQGQPWLTGEPQIRNPEGRNPAIRNPVSAIYSLIGRYENLQQWLLCKQKQRTSELAMVGLLDDPLEFGGRSTKPAVVELSLEETMDYRNLYVQDLIPSFSDAILEAGE